MNLHGTSRCVALAITTTLASSAIPLLSASPAAAAPGTLSLVATSADGAAFDVDEYAAGDITVQATDSVAGSVDVDDVQEVQYYWRVTPFDTSAPVVRLPATGVDSAPDDTAGEFVVPFPSGQPSGTYALFTRLVADAAGANSVPISKVLTVKAGTATLALDGDSDGGDDLVADAGTDTAITGRLALEDGTGLGGRAIDVGVVRGGAGSDPVADAGLVPAPPATAPVTSLQVTTATDGSFDVVLSDPAEDGQGTELGGTLQADTAATPGIGDADAGSTVAFDLVSSTAPAGSTLEISSPGAGTPGQALPGTVTVTAPDDTFDTDPASPGVQGDADSLPDPVEGQQYSLSLDHGFFTTGDEELPSVVGAAAGNVEDLGQTLTGLTDADGEVSFAVGIERDRDFDDDGLVTASVSAVAGDLTDVSTVQWSTSDPLNGGSVEVVRSPASEQVGPVDPALAGDRTYYDVFTLDQFGNRVGGEPVDLTYAGDLDDYDYSEDFLLSDFDRAGDLWVVSFEAGEIDVTGTWSAPTSQYSDTAGTAVAGQDDVVGSATSAFYELDFGASSFSMSSSQKDVAKVGSTVTQTVRVLDQLGNPVRGYQVKFFRFGPDSTDGEPRLTRVTNGRGQATYTFVGAKAGLARISAEVSDGTESRTLTDAIAFGTRVRARLSASDSGRKADRVAVKIQRSAANARVRLFRVTKGASTKVVGRSKIDASGRATFEVRDRNGRRSTTYVAQVLSTRTTAADTSNKVTTR